MPGNEMSVTHNIHTLIVQSVSEPETPAPIPKEATTSSLAVVSKSQPFFQLQPMYEFVDCSSDTTDTHRMNEEFCETNAPPKIIRIFQQQCGKKLETPLKMTKQDVMEYCKWHVGEGVTNFIEALLRLAEVAPKGSYVTDDFKKIALTVYFLGPKVYELLSKTFCLPSKSTLIGITGTWDVTTGLNEFLLGVIKTKVDTLKEHARTCIICVDEMPVEGLLCYNTGNDEIVGFHTTLTKKYELANNALVVMARGITNDWKQPVAYYFVKGSCSSVELKTIMFDIISKLTSIGLNVVGMVSDQGPTFVQFTTSLNIAAEDPYFVVNNQKVYYLFDTTHLLKSTRNNFLKYQFHITSGVTDAKYLRLFYERDKLKKYKLAPKLTDHHVTPTNVQNMNVELAAEIFSNTVASAIETYIALGVFPLSATATVAFIHDMNQLFEMLHSHTYSGVNEQKHIFNGSAIQVQFLNKMLDLFSILILTDKNNRNVTNMVDFIQGWRLTISSILEISRLCKENNIPEISTRRINKDCLENFCGKIREQGENNRNRTAPGFIKAYKKLFSENYFEHFDGANCLENLDGILAALNPSRCSIYNAVLTKAHILRSFEIDCTDYRLLELPSKNVSFYICGYILMKCLDKHSCTICVNFSSKGKHVSEEIVYSQFQLEHNYAMNQLMVPPDDCYEYAYLLDLMFCKLFPIISIQGNYGKSIKAALQKINFQHPCVNFPQDYFLTSFIDVRIFYTLTCINRDYKTCKDRKMYKINILKYR